MWKESKVWENKKFRVVIIVELLLVLIGIIGILQGNRIVLNKSDLNVALNAGTYLEDQDSYYIDGSTGYNGTYLETEQFELSPGVYKLRLYYETQDDGINAFGIKSSSSVFRGLLSNDITLNSGFGMGTCDFYLLEKTDKLNIKVDYNGTQGMVVKDFEIVHTTAGSRMFLFVLMISSLLINTLIMLYCYMSNHSVTTERILVWFGIPVITIIASLPLFTDYIIPGADGMFHWIRVEALAQSISQGVFPPRVEAMWLSGHGYANSIFYCDTFLILPALLCLTGFTLNTSYGIFVFVVNLATAMISYWCFKGCFKNRYIGVLGSLLYTLAPYRIYNIYNRNAVGEYTALIFPPLLCYGFYKLFTEDVCQKEYKYYWIPLTVGFSGMIQSHLLSCEIVGGFTILLCLILIKKVFRRETFWQLSKAVLSTILLNLWFLLPMLDMMISGEYTEPFDVGTALIAGVVTIIATICTTFVACVAGVWMLKHTNEVLKKGFFVVICGLCIFFSLYQTNDILMNKHPLRVYSVENIGNSAIFGAEYLPLGLEPNFQYHDAIPSEGVTVLEYSKENLDVNMEVEGYQGTLRTWYAGMWYWRVAEVVSLVTVVAILFIVLKRKKHEDKSLIER